MRDRSNASKLSVGAHPVRELLHYVSKKLAHRVRSYIAMRATPLQEESSGGQCPPYAACASLCRMENR
jgi:hypothetical protein